LKINYIGIVAGIIAIISIALPWWTVSYEVGGSGSLNLWGVSNGGTEVRFEWWFTSAAFAFLIIGGILGIVGSVIVGKRGKLILLGAGALSILSLIIFVAGFVSHEDWSQYTIFGSGTLFGVDYTSYLSFGFWLALVAAILAFVSTLKHPTAAAATA